MAKRMQQLQAIRESIRNVVDVQGVSNEQERAAYEDCYQRINPEANPRQLRETLKYIASQTQKGYAEVERSLRRVLNIWN